MSSVPDKELRIRLELLRARQALKASRRQLDEGVSTDLDMKLADCEKALRALQGSFRFRLGTLVVDSTKSPSGMLSLPWRLLKLVWQEKGPKGGGAPATNTGPVLLNFVTPPVIEKFAVLPAAIELSPLPGPSPAPAQLCDLRIAAVMDPFSLASFGPECQLFALHSQNWQSQVDAAKPHLLLVESAWRGESGEWEGLVERGSTEIAALVASCRRAGIPAVFWNKEDPLHFDAFLDTARLFDHVFTTDASSIPRYRRLLGHDRVGLLPFALQPRTHHPIQQGMRQPSSVFAGAWYGKMEDRCRDFEAVADALMLAGPMVIHDRHDGMGSPHQRFPQPYAPQVCSAVAYEETAAVYRSHRIGVNLNTIKQSPTMFARRALELIGCNTSVYGNHSLGLRLLFGDLTVASDDSQYLLSQAWGELRDPDARMYRQRRLRALRKVLREHTWAHRLQRVALAALGQAPSMQDDTVWVVARARDAKELAHIQAAVAAQGVQAELLLDIPEELELPSNARRLGNVEPGAGDWVAVFHQDDHYGNHYLEDLMLGRAFGLGDAVGKGAWFSKDQAGEGVLQQAGSEYRFVDALALRCSLFRRFRWEGSLSELLDDRDAGCLRGSSLVSLDTMNYLRNGAQHGFSDWDGASFDEGASLDKIEEVISRWQPAPDPTLQESDALSGAQLAYLLNLGVVPSGTSASAKGSALEICSFLADGVEDAMFSAVMPREVVERDGEIKACLQAPHASQLDLYLDPVDSVGQALDRMSLPRCTPVGMRPPAGTTGYRLAVAMRGQFVRPVDALWLGDGAPVSPLLLAGGNRMLIVCNGYPETDCLYRNAFVHRRVLEYKRRGLCVDVLSVGAGKAPRSYEFEGVLVQECAPATLSATLSASQYSAIGIHFLDRSIWDAVKVAKGVRRIVIWLHGADIQPWTRRKFNYRNEQECEQARIISDERMAFWRELLTSSESDRLHLVFVSRTFAEETWDDLGFRLPEKRWSVIPNPIDTNLFAYAPKAEELRFRILSIRPHHSRVYANDLVAQVIRKLAGSPVFPQLRFTLVGDGPLWEENFTGLEQYPNVDLVRCFLTQPEIASMHARHGVFLVPTRGDTQGVSRDEAMSSGLVPVTCNAGSVSDFVDECCGFICSPEDVGELADAILALCADPVRFQRLSASARKKVEEVSCGISQVKKELHLLQVINLRD